MASTRALGLLLFLISSSLALLFVSPYGVQGEGVTDSSMATYLFSADRPLKSEVVGPELDVLLKEISELQDFFARRPGIFSIKDAPVSERKYRRAFHAKGFCLRGELIISEQVPSELAHGIFAKKGKKFPIWARWSNGLGNVNADALPDVRGMAVKVFVDGVESADKNNKNVLDLLATNFPVPTTNTLEALVDFERSMAHNSKLVTLADSAKYMATHPNTVKVLVSSVLSPLRSYLLEQYWSGSPYKLGRSQHVKFNFAPDWTSNKRKNEPAIAGKKSNRLFHFDDEVNAATEDNADNRAGIVNRIRLWKSAFTKAKNTALDKDYLEKDAKSRLAEGSIKYHLNLQKFKDPKSTPMEDLFVEWKEKDAPSIQVATIVFPKQQWDTKLQEDCEEAQFNPGHVVEGHEVAGFLNKGRVHAYRHSGNNRNNKNHADL